MVEYYKRRLPYAISLAVAVIGMLLPIGSRAYYSEICSIRVSVPLWESLLYQHFGRGDGLSELVIYHNTAATLILFVAAIGTGLVCWRVIRPRRLSELQLDYR